MDQYITSEALHDAVDEKAAPLVIDVRSADEYDEGRLPGALHLPVDDLAERVGGLPPDRPMVTCCTMRHRGDSRSGRAAALLRKLGREAHTLEGGMPAWEGAGYPVEREGR